MALKHKPMCSETCLLLLYFERLIKLDVCHAVRSFSLSLFLPRSFSLSPSLFLLESSSKASLLHPPMQKTHYWLVLVLGDSQNNALTEIVYNVCLLSPPPLSLLLCF